MGSVVVVVVDPGVVGSLGLVLAGGRSGVGPLLGQGRG